MSTHTTTHSHTPETAQFDMRHSGCDGRNYIYAYRFRCACGAELVRPYRSAEAATAGLLAAGLTAEAAADGVHYRRGKE